MTSIPRCEVLAVFAATALTAGITPATIARAAADPQTGSTAPGFSATDARGKRHTLSAYKGKIIVLEWTNHECPYTVKHYDTGNMQALQKSATDSGVVWFTVESSWPGTQGHVNALEADKLTDDRDARPTAVLLDPSGNSAGCMPLAPRRTSTSSILRARWYTWARLTISPRPTTQA